MISRVIYREMSRCAIMAALTREKVKKLAENDRKKDLIKKQG